jgi:uncharacterized oligopeptide transporter (OPT) family protein
VSTTDNHDDSALGLGAHRDPQVSEKVLTLSELGQLPPEERELYWYKHFYKGDDVPQLTVRAVLIGSLLGGLMSLSNLYIGLKTGWALGISITACILAYSLNKIFRMHMSILENNCMQSTASSAGYSTGGTMVSGVAAYLMLTGHHMSWPVLVAWTFFLAMLGVFIAIPMKRQMIDVDQLPFPTGMASAETLLSLHGEGEEARQKAGALFAWGGLSAVWKIGSHFMEKAGMSTVLYPPTLYRGYPFSAWTMGFDLSLVLLAAGAIVGWKTCWSMLLGSFICYGVLAPAMVEQGAIHADKLGFREIVSWSTWPGAAMLVTSGLFFFALQWRTILRAVSGMGAMLGRGGSAAVPSEADRIQVPNSWFVVGTLIAGAGCVVILNRVFDTSIPVAIAAVALSFVLSLVACRATGETDITPMGPMGKIAQLTFSWMAPSNMVTNLMTAGVTAGAASASADLLTDLRSGYILGANPRRQFIAQFLGIFAGTAVIVPAFLILVPTPETLGGQQWPAPSAQVWKKVAELLAQGISALHPTAQKALLIGAVLGVVLPLIEMSVPKHVRRFIPSATGIGLAFIMPFTNAFSFFIGAFIALMWERSNKEHCEKYMVPVASGVIAGESLTGVGIALSDAIPGLVETLRKG